MTVQGLDYSAGRPSGTAIRAAGYSFVVRYLDNGLSGRANLTAAEVVDLRRSGVDVAVVWERKLIGQPDRATEGGAAGAADARTADAQCAVVGLAGWPVYLAVDFDIPDYAPASTDPRAKLGPVGDYLAAARDVLGLGRAGVYGGYWAVKRALDAGLVSWGWQTMAWSGNNVDPRIHLLQTLGQATVGGVGCDVNEARKVQFGQAVATAHPSRSGADEMTSYIAKISSAQPDGSFTAVATQDGPVVHAATWANVKATVDKQGGGGLTGLTDVEWNDRVATSDAFKAAAKVLAAGLPSGGGTAGASRADVEQVVDAAFADHNATLTYNKIVGN